MPAVAHLSDLHFGEHDPAVVAALEQRLAQRRPDLVAISGDFSQRARRKQFRMAAAFVERLERRGLKVLAVPGNHDVPLYDVVRRFLWPLTRYRRFIASDLCPEFRNDELVVLGINTARSLTIKDGRISEEQLERIHRTFEDPPPDALRVLVTHHPLFELPLEKESSLSRAVDDHLAIVEGIADSGVQVLLAGHFHRTYAASARDMVERAGPTLVIQAGTATSTRLRGEPQSFNWIERDGAHVALTVEFYRDGAFHSGDTARYACVKDRWKLI
jgi:3',5'-cyclic AMP phosphodiesterase CpdA